MTNSDPRFSAGSAMLLGDLLDECISVEICTVEDGTKQHTRRYLSKEDIAVLANAVNHTCDPAQPALDAAIAVLVDRMENNPLGWLPGIGDCVNVTFDLKEAKSIVAAIRALYASQPSPAATVEPFDVMATIDPDHAESFERETCQICNCTNGHSLSCPSISRDYIDADPLPRSSAGNGDAGCGAAVITPWADQYNACWDRSKPDALKLAALKALNYIENTEDELGMKLSCGDALREALK